MPSLNIHRNDTVKVLAGSDRGKTGRVLRVFPDKGTVLVEHVRVVKKTVSSKQGQRTKGGIAEQESPDQCVECGCWSAPTADRRAWATRLKARASVRDLQEVWAELPTKK